MTQAVTLDAEYQARGLIRPSQFRKLDAANQGGYETVTFDWKGTKVHGFKPKFEAALERVGEALASQDPHRLTAIGD